MSRLQVRSVRMFRDVHSTRKTLIRREGQQQRILSTNLFMALVSLVERRARTCQSLTLCLPRQSV